MCIVIGKYFNKYGWVGIKNRDRNYVPEISFKKGHHKGVEILYFWDDITQYCEGLNSAGISILSASLMVLDDEKEIEKRSKRASKDGIKIRKALRESNLQSAVQSLIDQKLTGNTIIFTPERLYLLEGSWRPGGYSDRDYAYKVREIRSDQQVVRTNHGIWLPWAGYQYSKEDLSQTQSRISSEVRRIIGEYVIGQSRDPEDIIDQLTYNWTDNGQLNSLRTAGRTKKMRTTAQIMLVPSESTMYVRPIQSHITYNFWELNRPREQTWVEILSNRILYSNLRDLSDLPPWGSGLHHSV